MNSSDNFNITLQSNIVDSNNIKIIVATSSYNIITSFMFTYLALDITFY